MEDINRATTSKALRRGDSRYTLVPNTSAQSSVWTSFNLIEQDGSPVPNICGCVRCYQIFTYRDKDGRSVGTSGLLRHSQQFCKLAGSASGTRQLTLHQTVRSPVAQSLSERETEKVKDATLNFVIKGFHSFRSAENEGLYDLCQTLVDIAATRSQTFDVKTVLFGRKSVQRHLMTKVNLVKVKLQESLTERFINDCVSYTLDMTTDDLMKRSYLDIHAFWITEDFELCHCPIAVRHFGTAAHTGRNICDTYLDVVSEYGFESEIPVVTDKGANVVLALSNAPRLDCMDHRLHTCLSKAWDVTKIICSEARDYDAAASSLSTYAKQTSGIQERIPITLKYGGNTRPWTALYNRANAINRSYDELRPILREKGRSALLMAVNRDVHEGICSFLEGVNSLFLKLESADLPSLQNVVPTYYKLMRVDCRATANDCETVRTLKLELRKCLDEKFYDSIKAYHWIACFLDPSFKDFGFVPKESRDEKKFFGDLMQVLDGWVRGQLEDIKAKWMLDVNDSSVVAAPLPKQLRRSDDPFAALRQVEEASESRRTSQTLEIAGEIGAYKDDTSASPDINNPLMYWKEKQSQYPLLTRFAKKIFTAPASSAQSERDFSYLKLILHERRSRRDPKTVEAIELVHGAFAAKLI